MIRIHTRRVKRPDFFTSEVWKRFVRDLRSFHESGGSRAKQSRFPWRRRLEPFLPKIDSHLLTVFGHKCAYTEVELPEPEDRRLVLHRPAADAIGLDGEPSPEHYWWLIPALSNWYLATPSVGSVKGTQFPVVGQRSKPPTGTRLTRSATDRGLLLDPRRDEPVWHLEFHTDGHVYPRVHPSQDELDSFGGESRGEHTIRILDLNNEWLVQQRSEAVGRMEQGIRALEEAFAASQPTIAERLVAQMVSALAPFAGLRRQWLARWVLGSLHDSGGASPSQLAMVTPRLKPELSAELLENPLPLTPAGKKLLRPVADYIAEQLPEVAEESPAFREVFGRRSPRIAGRAPRPFALESAAAPEPRPSRGPRMAAAPRSVEAPPDRQVVYRSARIAHIQIKNFKAIREVELDLSTRPVRLLPRYGDPDRDEIEAVGWKTLLGENGSGKSCFLEAVGLALAGEHLPKILAEGGLSWQRMLRRPATPSEIIRQGRVLLRLTGDVQIDLRFNRNKHWWVGGVPRIDAFVRGYGATRLLEGGDSARQDLREAVRVANLYDPKAPVIDAESWLLSLDEGDFNAVAVTLDELLSGTRLSASALGNGGAPPDEPMIVPDRDAGKILVAGDPLDLVSDGYRAVIAIACDIIAGLGEGLSDLRNARGIVLIDEIGAHLHPSWRMALTEKLRRALPNVQFLVSTHEPLCLRGLFGKEVVRVRKLAELGVTLEEVERSPSDYRVDQLLTSEFFGLDTTIDPDLELRFQAYYRLLALAETARTPEQQAELRELRVYLRQHSRPALGHTRRDQLVYEAIDEFLKDQRTLGVAERKAKRRDTLKRVVDIWEGRRALFPQAARRS